MNDTKGEIPRMAPGVIIGFLAGLSAGAILGILFAPKKGEETRRELKEKAASARSRVQQQMAAQKDRLTRAGQKAAETSKETVEEAEQAAEESITPR